MLTNELDAGEAVRFIQAIGTLLQYKRRDPEDLRPVTTMLSYAPSGWVSEDMLAATTTAEDLDVIHLEFDPGGEAEGPANIMLCEDRNGEILTWPECELWADRDSPIILLTPRGQDFGFASDGAALIRVTDLDTGPGREQGVARAHALLMSTARRMPTPRRA